LYIQRSYQFQIQDKGESARKLLEGCLKNNEVWYEQMGKNLRLIEDLAANLAASKELEKEDFLEWWYYLLV